MLSLMPEGPPGAGIIQMKWSWKVGQLAGIDVRIHATFFLIFAWIAARYWMAGAGADGMLASMGFILALFLCVLLHELGHAITAREFGIRTMDITLLPIGGLARLERMPEAPRQELLIALAGPLVNVAISAVLYAWLTVAHAWAPLSQLHLVSGPFVERLLVANVWLVLFNLIPAFPMDGGRVLRAVLATRIPHSRATQIAASIGQGLAFVFGFAGLFLNPMLLLIGLFIWIGAAQESGLAQMKPVLAATPVRAAMLRNFDELHAGDTLADAVRLILDGSQRDFPVLERGQVIGILLSADLLAALENHGQHHPVTSVMRREFPVAYSAETLETVHQRLEEWQYNIVPVLHDGGLAGLVTLDNLGEYLLIQATLRKHRTRVVGGNPTLVAKPRREPAGVSRD
jgi:Zn-dependent protease/CBS domain-containing protein